ncbi:hypothetical protein [Cryptosporangium sp. NPDC048952]|uniref:hypothetical protein n=1 Tax=Cryptosporangium sp. NPDC048952 TaxID=3363961 RepID=UPI00371B61AE
MPTIRSRGLSTADLDTLRTAVEAGRKPKVQFTSSAGQIAGQIGQIVRFDDPSSDEWVVVRFGRDELPFAPTDLQLAPKAPPRQKSAPKATMPSDDTASATAVSPTGAAPRQADRAGSAGSPAAVAAATSTATRSVTAAATPAEAAASAKPAAKAGAARAASSSVDAAGTAAKSAGAGRPAASAPAASAPAASAPAASTPAEAAGAAKAAPKSRPARKGAAKRAPDLTVTLAHHEGAWTVSAARGARVLVKPTSVRAADALKMVALLESPAVADAVDEIVSAARAEAEEQAERLRQQLAEVEAALADLTDPEE